MQVLSQFHDLILCVISALEARDIYTSHHSSRVAEMTEKDWIQKYARNR